MNQQSAYFLQLFLNIIQLASFYAPLAVAFSLIQAITRRVFLSFGDFAMFGSFAAVYVCFGRLLQGDNDGMAAAISLAVAIPCAGALGKVSAKYVFAPMLKSSALSFMIAAIGFSIALEELMRLTSESRDIWIPPLFQGQRLSLVGGDFPVNITANYAFATLIAVLSILALIALVRFTQFGRNWQACSENLNLAKLCGVNTESVIQQTFILGTALSAVSGWMTAITYGGTSFSVGIMLGFKAMFAAVAGGFGSINGAIAGAISLSALEVIWSAGFGTTYRDVGVFSVIVLVLLLRPEGLGGIHNLRESEG
jgi:branched-chain amino acid transport system permease protein